VRVFANIIFPVMSYFYFSMLLSPWLAIILLFIETTLLKKFLKDLTWTKSFLVILIANTVSTAIGAVITLFPLESLGYDSNYPVYWWLASFTIAFTFSVITETPVIMYFFKSITKKVAYNHVIRFNLISYLVLLVISYSLISPR